MTPERLLGRRASYRIARYFIPSGQHLNDGNADAECGALKQCAAQAFVTGSRLRFRNLIIVSPSPQSSTLKIRDVCLDLLPIQRRSMRRVPMKAHVSDLTAIFFAVFGFTCWVLGDSCIKWIGQYGLVPRQNYDRLSNQVHKPGIQFGSFTCKTGLMLRPLRLILVLYSRFFHSRRDLLLENLALRQQLGVLQRRRPQPRFGISDKFFWGILRRLWSGWSRALLLVQPETVIRWHRAGFKLYWTWLSHHRARVGRKDRKSTRLN